MAKTFAPSDWTNDFTRIARLEGWQLSTRDDGFFSIERFDEDPEQRFPYDGEAYAFVARQYRAGSYMHDVAMHLDQTRWYSEAPDYVALARDAGYDGSPGGEREWCIGNGMVPKVEE